MKKDNDTGAAEFIYGNKGNYIVRSNITNEVYIIDKNVLAITYERVNNLIPDSPTPFLKTLKK